MHGWVEVGFWGREGREPVLQLGLERMVLESALPGAESFFFFYFSLLLFSRIQFGFYYKIDQKHIF